MRFENAVNNLEIAIKDTIKAYGNLEEAYRYIFSNLNKYAFEYIDKTPREEVDFVDVIQSEIDSLIANIKANLFNDKGFNLIVLKGKTYKYNGVYLDRYTITLKFDNKKLLDVEIKENSAIIYNGTFYYHKRKLNRDIILDVLQGVYVEYYPNTTGYLDCSLIKFFLEDKIPLKECFAFCDI